MKRIVAMVLVLAMLLALGGTAGAEKTLCENCNQYTIKAISPAYGNTTWYDIAEEYHIKYTGTFEECLTCHYQKVRSLESTKKENHFYNYKHFCSCGKAEPNIGPVVHDCYENMDAWKEYVWTSYQQYSHEKHIEWTIYDTQCNICGESKSRFEYDDYRDHVFSNGVCIHCEYVKPAEAPTPTPTPDPCANHSWDGMQGMYFPQFSYTKQAEWYVYSPYPGSTDHSVKLMWTVTCNTCGESVTSVRADYYAAEQCTYRNGVCTKCNGKQPGYTPPTPTPTPTKVPVTPAPVTQAPVTPAPATEVPVTPVPGGCSHEAHYSQGPATWHQFDGANHIMIAMNHYRCDCGQVDYEDQVEAVYPHQFVDGVCRLCGYVDANAIVSVTYSEHPHYYRTDVYADGHTEVVENEDGYKLSRELCDECYPVEFNADTLMEMALWAMDAYNTRDLDPTEYPEHLKDAVRFNDIDCLVVPKLTDDGKMCLTISFEGSKEGKDWLQDFLAESNEHGMHSGIAHDFGLFVSEHAEELFALLGLVRKSGGSIQITGHSYGGGMTQLMVYWLLTEYDFPKDKLTAYTFASPVVLSYDAVRDEELRGANVFNIINTNDEVPDVGITHGYEHVDLFPVVDVVAESVLNLGGNHGLFGGGYTVSGCNIGKNFYLRDEVKDTMLSDSFLFGQHSMEKYKELVIEAINGEQRGYMLNMEEFIFEDSNELIKKFRQEAILNYYGGQLSFYEWVPGK